MVMSSAATNRVLVRLSDITQELTVGLGAATASVRTLTDVSLVVRERELVVLSGSRGAGERALLAVVAGDRRGVLGTCEVANGARIRIMRIRARSALALAEEWQRADAHEVLRPSDAVRPDVFLLDVVPDADNRSQSHHERAIAGAARQVVPNLSPNRVQTSRVRETRADVRGHVHERAGANDRDARAGETRAGDTRAGDRRARAYAPKPWDEKNRAALRAWAEVCRMRGGAVIMAAGDSVGRGLFDAALRQVGRSRVSHGAPTAVREVLLEESAVRVVAMHSGRLASTVRLRSHDLPA